MNEFLFMILGASLLWNVFVTIAYVGAMDRKKEESKNE
jgi:hypothetical protein